MSLLPEDSLPKKELELQHFAAKLDVRRRPRANSLGGMDAWSVDVGERSRKEYVQID